MTTDSWLIVGLGNPGPTYRDTRHNLGARIVEAFQAATHAPPFREEKKFFVRISEGTIRLALPTTYMNESGQAVAALMQFYKTPLGRLLVVHDDKDLAFGEIRMQRERSSAGHRGVQSIIDALGSNEFWRLRVGVGGPPPGVETDAFVLQPFTEEECRVLLATVLPSTTQHILTATNVG